ncbi:MAG: serine protease [Terracidiphilus sp.]
MKSFLHAWSNAAILIVLLLATLTRPCLAANWKELGNADNSLDKVYIDADSVEQVDGFRFVRIMTVYPSPRPNSHNITMDSHIQQDAFDCEKKMFYGIQLIGYLNGQQVGTGPLATDWKTKMIPGSNTPLSQRILTAACSLPLTTGGKKAPDATPPDLQHPAPTRSPLLDGENLLFAPPKDFKLGFHSDRNGSMNEYVPNGQTVEDWTEMLTVQVFRDLKEMEPAAFLQRVGTKWLSDCPETPKDTIRNGHVNGYPASMLELKCPNVHAKGKPETTVFRAIKGKDALYSVQHAWRTVPSDEAKDALSRTDVCDTRDPSHPCPSFDTLAPPAQAQPKPKFSTGSGIIVNDDGYILTNAHVVKGCKSISVKPLNVDALTAKLEAIDPKNDLALIKTTAGYGQPAQFRPESKPANLGESIGVVGYPLTGFLSAEPKATFGQINSVAGAGNDYTLLQISAPIQAGNSGSPVLDAAGNVIAIVVSEAASLSQLLKNGTVPQNVNFAIRGELAQIFMQAHGVSFKVGDHKRELRTDQIADAGQRSTVFIVCSYE